MTAPPSGAPPGDGAARSVVPPTPRADFNENTHFQCSTSAETEPSDAFAWLANLSPTEYEGMRRRLARERGWRVAALDRLYRDAQRKAGSR